MTALNLWLIIFIPLQLMFDFYTWHSIGSAKNFLKHVGFKAIIKANEEYERIHGNDSDGRDED